MPVTFRLKSSLTLPVDVASLTLEKLRELSEGEISRLPIWHGNQQVPCGDLFKVTGSAQDGELNFEGDCSRVKSIGAGMNTGVIRVTGHAGMHLGAQMSGGEIHVSGNAGDWVGAEMRKGLIQITGSAGHQVGAAYRGSKKGMSGGEILIHGNAGNEIGRNQRRGLIAIGGETGEGTGFGLIAGTILVAGRCGALCGAGMKRGSIILLDENSTAPSSTTFRYTTTGQPTFLQLYLRHLQDVGFPLNPDSLSARYRMYRGDFLELGKGELLCIEPG